MRPIKFLAISASPRRNGNTAYLMGRALESLQTSLFDVDIKTYTFSGKRFFPCCGCLKCYNNGGECIFKDDFDELRQLWLDADCILYASPVYHAGIPGQLKTFIDRLGNSLFGYYPVSCMRHMKIIGLISQGGDFPGGQELCAIDIMRHAALSDCLYIAPDGSYFCSSAWADGPNGIELAAKSTRKTPDIEISIKTAQSTVKRMIEMAAIVLAGAQMLEPKLKSDKYYTSLYTRIATNINNTER